MKHKILIGMIFTLLLISAVSANDLSLNSVGTLSNYDVGSSISSYLELNNTGTTAITSFTNTYSKLTGSSYNYTPSIIFSTITSLDPSELENLTYSFSLPSTIYADTYNFEINVTDSNNNSNNLTKDLQLVVNSNPSLSLSTLSTQSIIEGTSKNITLNLINNGNTDLTVTFDSDNLVGRTNSSATLSKSNISYNETSLVIPFQESRNVLLTISLPDSIESQIYFGNITAKYGSKETNTTLNINVLESIYSVSSSSNSGEYVHSAYVNKPNITIINNGNKDLTNIEFKFSDLSNGVDTISSTLLSSSIVSSLAVDESTTVDVDIATLSTNIDGTFTGTVNITNDNFEKIQSITLVVRSSEYDVSFNPSSINNSVNLNTTYIKEIKIKNVGDLVLSNGLISTNIKEDFYPNLSISSTGTFSSTLSLGNIDKDEEKTFYLKYQIPEKYDSGEIDLGDLIFTSNEYSENISSIAINIEPKLSIYSLKMKVDGSTKTVDAGDSIDASPGDDIEIIAKIENLYNSDEDIKIENVYMNVFVDGIDESSSDIDEDSREEDLRAEKKSDFTVDFSIPKTASEDEYDVDVTIDGKDENGLKQVISRSFKINVKRESHDLRVTNLDLSPSNLDCNDKSTTLYFRVENWGDDDEDDVKVTAKNSKMDLDWSKSGIDLTSDYEDSDSYERFSVDLDLLNLLPGNYPITIETFYDGDRKGTGVNNTVVQNLVIKSCNAVTTGETTIVSKPEVSKVLPTPNVVDNNNIAPEIKITKESSSFKDSSLYTPTLVVGSVIGSGVLIYLLFLLFL